jgi:hypothetical protein
VLSSNQTAVALGIKGYVIVSGFLTVTSTFQNIFYPAIHHVIKQMKRFHETKMD